MAHPQWLQLRAVQAGRVYLSDGNQCFNRPGPRLVDSLKILAKIFTQSRLPTATEARVGSPYNSGNDSPVVADLRQEAKNQRFFQGQTTVKPLTWLRLCPTQGHDSSQQLP